MGDIIGFLRLEHGNPPRLQLLFKHIPSGTETLVDEIEVPGADPARLDVLNDIINEGLLKDTLSAPAFSPDGSVFAYVREGSTLVEGAIDRSNGKVLFINPIATFPEQDGLMHKLYQPSIDAANTYVLVTDIRYVLQPNETTNELERIPVAMKPVLISLADNSKRVLFEDEDQYMDGPAVFIPGSRDILFASTRLGLNIMTPFGTVAPAIRLFRTDPLGSDVQALESHDAMFLFGPLSISADGAFASMAGMVSTDASGADLIVFDLSSGMTLGLGRDPISFCFPFAGEATCRMSSFKSAQGEDIYIVSCCRPDDEGGGCCDFDTGLLCSSWEVMPAFSQAGSIAASSLSIVWICGDGEGAFAPASAGMNMLFASIGEGDSIDYEYITSSLGAPLVPDFRTIARLPDGAGQ
ncbi:MAG: hypothetical protein D6806_09290 [Deltaproteobacteria bacterium]|nr:MAG: hypothetical protein D6806_09290 [Deltaproteobacteria bacterium]